MMLNEANVIAENALRALPVPVLVIALDGAILHANPAAEDFFQAGLLHLKRQSLADLVPFGSPILALVDEVARRGTSMNEYRVALGLPRLGVEHVVDAFANPAPDGDGSVVLMLQERTIAEKMGRQLDHRGAARSISAMGSMLAHEIKNPLSGIRGAAQLLETVVSDEDRMLTRLICEETDRIVKLVESVEVFGDERPFERGPVNIHTVLDHVKRLASSGFASHIRFVENYDPSLPPVDGNRDHLIQVLLNLVKNAAEAIGPEAPDGEITLSTAYRPGMRLQMPGSTGRVALPLEIGVRDNGPGVPADVMPYLFDPFVTTKIQGSGLGLALVSKMIGDHGGIIECDSSPKRTLFRILLPAHSARDGRES